MTLSVRNARLATLLAWAGFLVWLAAAGQIPRYLGPRTAWIVPVGAATLLLAAAIYAHHTRTAPVADAPLRLREAGGLAAVLAPVLVGLVMSSATLGSLAAGNKLSGRGVDVASLARSLGGDSKRLDFLLLRGADEDARLARERGILPGRRVRLTGFVFRPAAAGRPLRLARFYITCCVADSVAMDVAVYPAAGAPAFRRDDWVRATGVLGRRDGHLVVEGARLRAVPKPEHPYKLFRL